VTTEDCSDDVVIGGDWIPAASSTFATVVDPSTAQSVALAVYRVLTSIHLRSRAA
jgi:hypothetical protein